MSNTRVEELMQKLVDEPDYYRIGQLCGKSFGIINWRLVLIFGELPGSSNLLTIHTKFIKLLSLIK